MDAPTRSNEPELKVISYATLFSIRESHIAIKDPIGSKYFGVRVEPYDPKRHDGLKGLALFQVNNQNYVSHLDWHSLTYGFTAKTLENLTKEEQTPRAIGNNIIGKMHSANEKFKAAHAQIRPLLPDNPIWEAQLAKTMMYVARNQDKLTAPFKEGQNYEIIKKDGVVKRRNVEWKKDGPGFKVVRTPTELFVRIRVYMTRIDERGKLVKLTEQKQYFNELDLNSMKLFVRVKHVKTPSRAGFWKQEIEVAKAIVEARNKKQDLTGLLVPLHIIEDQLIFPMGSGDLLDVINSRSNSFMDNLKVACDLSHGIAALHSLGYAHRDVKPHNAVWFPTDLTPALCDNEYSCKSEGKADLIPAGTAPYQGPETITGLKNVDAKKIDSWALGISLFMLFQGITPSHCGKKLDRNFPVHVNAFLNWLHNYQNMDADVKATIQELLTVDLDQRGTVANANARLEALRMKCEKEWSNSGTMLHRVS